MRLETDEKVFNIIKIREKASALEYWESQPYSKRLEALEEIRSEYINWKYGAEQGFQRICTVAKLK